MTDDGRLPPVAQLAQPRRGHFDLGTGYHGDLWLDLDALSLRPARLRPYVQWVSAQLDAHQIDAVCGPLEGGAFLALAVADVLDTAFVPAGRPPGPGPGQPGYRLPPGMGQRAAGWRVAIVEAAKVRKKQDADAYMLIVPIIRELLDKGFSYRDIANELNERGHRTTKGTEFVAPTVFRIFKRQGGRHGAARTKGVGREAVLAAANG